MFEQRLMERIARGAAGVHRSEQSVDLSAVLEDVLQHLSEILNARQGSVPTRPDYGMPDMNDLLQSFPDALAVLRTAITEQIRMFEPRLQAVAVRHEPDAGDPLRINFTVTAELLAEQMARPISFHTALADDGGVTLRA